MPKTTENEILIKKHVYIKIFGILTKLLNKDTSIPKPSTEKKERKEILSIMLKPIMEKNLQKNRHVSA